MHMPEIIKVHFAKILYNREKSLTQIQQSENTNVLL